MQTMLFALYSYVGVKEAYEGSKRYMEKSSLKGSHVHMLENLIWEG